MKLKKVFVGVLLAIVGTLSLSSPILATEDVDTSEEDDGVYVIEQKENTDDHITFGDNLVLAGGDISNTERIRGLLFAFGSNLKLGTSAEYGFMAGRTVDFNGTVSRDLFVAGEIVNITSEALVGRDLYAAGQEVNINADVNGNLFVATDYLKLGSVSIYGDLQVNASRIEFSDDTIIDGTFKYNKDAELVNFDSSMAEGTETYERAESKTGVGDVILSKIMSAVSLFVVIALLTLAIPKIKTKITEDSTLKTPGQYLAKGAGFVFILPMLAVLLLFTIIGIPASFAILVTYGLGLYLASGIACAWFGDVLLAKICKAKVPFLVELALGIIVYEILGVIPYVSVLVWLASVIYGAGILMNMIIPEKKSKK